MGIGDTYEASQECATALPGWHLGVRVFPTGGRARRRNDHALKELYERYHTKDIAALKNVYERHAKDCVQAAELTVDPGRREVFLKLARQWTEAAAALEVSTQ
jgi:hypothetical protein